MLLVGVFRFVLLDFLFFVCCFLFSFSNYSHRENSKLTCCSPRSKISKICCLLLLFLQIPFFSPGAEWGENSEGIVKRSEGALEMRGCCLVLLYF